MSEHQCVHKIFRGWGSHICGVRASLNEDGKWWCRAHAPSCVAARDAKREAKWAIKAAQQDRRNKIIAARDRIVAAALVWNGTNNSTELHQAIEYYRNVSDKP